MPAYIQRLIDGWLEELVADVPAVLLVGPRASGKTTTAKRVAATTLALDRSDVRRAVTADPDAVLRDALPPVLVDEWQLAPDALGAAKRIVDADPSPGRFVFAGSATDGLVGAWPGTGRFIRVAMWGLTERELAGSTLTRRPTFFDKVSDADFDGTIELPDQLPDTGEYVDRALRSGFPEAVARRSDRARRAWLDSYADHLVQRDTSMIAEVRDASTLRRYLAALAASTAGTPKLTTLLDAVKIRRETATRFDHVLERLFVSEQVPAWSTNHLSRIGRRTKRYLCDAGLAGALLGVDRRMVLRSADLCGRIIDTFVASQLRAELALGVTPVSMFHLQYDAKREVDLVLESRSGDLVAVEIKAAVDADLHDARHLVWLRDSLPTSAFRCGVVFTTGRHVVRLADRIWAVPICALWA